MQTTTQKAARGLLLLFIAQLLPLGGVLPLALSWVFHPFVELSTLSSLLSLASLFLSLLGLAQALPAHDGYKSALYLTLGALVASLAQSFFGGWMFGDWFSLLFSSVTSLLNLAMVYFLCRGTADLLTYAGFEEDGDQCHKIWWFYFGCTLAGWLLSFLLNLNLGIISVLFSILSVAAIIFILAASLCVLSMLWSGWRTLR